MTVNNADPSTQDTNKNEIGRKTTFRVIVALLFVMLLLLFTRAVSAQAEIVAYHGSVASPPRSYGSYNGNVFYSAGDQLYRFRFDDAGILQLTRVQFLFGPTLGFGVDLNAEFYAYGDGLFFHANRRYGDGRTGRFLHRLRHSNGEYQLTGFDIPAEPTAWDPDYADNTNGFAEYNNRLYFFGSRTNFRFSDAQSPQTSAVFSIGEDDDLKWVGNTDSRYYIAGSLQSTDLGVIASMRYPGEPRYGAPGGTRYFLIDDFSEAIVADPLAVAANSAFFDGVLFYTGSNNDVGNTEPPTIGPFPDTGLQTTPIAPVPYQIELMRRGIVAHTDDYYDLHPTSYEWAEDQAAQNNAASSSSPAAYHQTPGALFLTAYDGDSRKLFRIDSVDALPEVVNFATTAVGPVTPVSTTNDQLWITADFGQGLDLHYLRYDNDPNPVALNLSTTQAQTASGFFAYGNDVFFTAKDINNDWWTYVVRQPENGLPTSNDIKLVTNGAYDANGYVLIDNRTKQWITGACRQQLVDAGLKATVSNWGEISNYSDTDNWQSCPDLVAMVENGGGPDDSIQLLLNGAGDPNAYVVVNGEARQWIDGNCREQLINAGLNSTVSNWGEISGFAETLQWKTCAQLVALAGSGGNPPGGGPDSIDLLLNGADDRDGYVIIGDQTWQWVGTTCRQQLVEAGLTARVSNWGEISSYEGTMDWKTCAELVAMTE